MIKKKLLLRSCHQCQHHDCYTLELTDSIIFIWFLVFKVPMQLSCQHDRAEENAKAQLSLYISATGHNCFSVLTPNFHGFFSSAFLSPFLGIHERPFEQTVEASDALSAMFALYLAVEFTNTWIRNYPCCR